MKSSQPKSRRLLEEMAVAGPIKPVARRTFPKEQECIIQFLSPPPPAKKMGKIILSNFGKLFKMDMGMLSGSMQHYTSLLRNVLQVGTKVYEALRSRDVYIFLNRFRSYFYKP